MKIEDKVGTKIKRALTIDAQAPVLAAIWSDPEQLKAIMGELVEVTPLSPYQARFRVKGPLATEMEWSAEATRDAASQSVHWRAIPESGSNNDLEMVFSPAPGEQGTEARLTFIYQASGGAVGSAVMDTFAVAPDIIVWKVLRRLKAFVEAGEFPTLQYTSSARKTATEPGEQK